MSTNQRRAYDRGVEVARVVEVGPSFHTPGWLWDRPLILGTRLDARQVADTFKAFGMDECIAQYCITPEMVTAAVVWRQKHPRWRAKHQ